MFNYTAIPFIVVICYVAVTAIKATKLNKKWYPIISCAIGAVVGLALFLIAPEFIGAATLAAAIISGAVSGLAATGTDQVFKQLMKSAQNGTLIIENDVPQNEISRESNNDGATDDTGGKGKENK